MQGRVIAVALVFFLAGACPTGRCLAGEADKVPTRAPAKVDFARDVMPLFRQSCIQCHGPKKQKNGLRLDRRSSAMKPVARRVIPGSSDNSMLYHRLIGEEYGTQMPPKGALGASQIAIIKAWIDQGAPWPDSLANERELPPLDPKAVASVELLRNNDMAGFLRVVERNPALLNARGPEGSTPFMYAALYANADLLANLLGMGADVNKRNDANATALMWAARDLEKTRLLINHGADVNARSDDLRTPLMIAARRPGGAPIVKLLLDKGANPNPNAKPTTQSSPLLEALTAGDVTTVKLLIERGADVKATADQGLGMAATLNSRECLGLLAERITDKAAYTLALPVIATLGDAQAARVLVDHGADVNAFDPLGKTPLMYAAVSDVLPLELVKLLVEHGANVNAIDRRPKSGDSGLSVLDIARQNGHTTIVDFLVERRQDRFEGGGRSAAREAQPRARHPRGRSGQPSFAAARRLLFREERGVFLLP